MLPVTNLIHETSAYTLDDALRLVQMLLPDAIMHHMGRKIPLVNIDVSDVIRAMQKWDSASFKSALTALGIDAYKAWREADDAAFINTGNANLKRMVAVPLEVRRTMPDNVVQLVMWLAIKFDERQCPTFDDLVIDKINLYTVDGALDADCVIRDLSRPNHLPSLPKNPGTWSKGGFAWNGTEGAVRMCTDPLVINLAPFAWRMKEYLKQMNCFKLDAMPALADGFTPRAFTVVSGRDANELKVSSRAEYRRTGSSEILRFRLVSSTDGLIAVLVAELTDELVSNDPEVPKYNRDNYKSAMDKVARTMHRLADPAEWDISNPEALFVRMMTVTRECVRCHRKLKDPRSIEAGMGPVCSLWWKGLFSFNPHNPHKLHTNWQAMVSAAAASVAVKDLTKDMLGMPHLKSTSPLVVELEQVLRDCADADADADVKDEDIDAQIVQLLAKVFPAGCSREMITQAARDLHLAYLLRWRWTPPSVERHEAAIRLAVHTTTNVLDMASSIPMLAEMSSDKKMWFFAALPPTPPVTNKGNKKQRTR